MNDTITHIKDRYAVFGNPISHSKSPILHMSFAQETQQDISYSAECVVLEQFNSTANHFFSHGGLGLNITVPFKIDAFHYADELTPRAKKAGAVNTLIKKNNKIIGDNTDGVGFVNDLLNNLHWALKNKRVLILGAGGAVRGILQPLLKANVNSILIANRTPEKAVQLANDFKDEGSIAGCHYSDLHNTNESFDIIINGTSASLTGNLPDLPTHIIHSGSCCYDMMYAKEDTIFMRWAKQHHAKEVADGVGMLVSQGAESFYQWRHVKPNISEVIKKVRASL